MAIKYDSANNQVIFNEDSYIKRAAANSIQVGNSSTGPIISDHVTFTSISTPSTPSAGQLKIFSSGSEAAELYVLNSGGVAQKLGIEVTDPLSYKGAIDCSANPNYPAANAGDTYRISVAGKIGGASGPNVEAGDMIICFVDSSASGTHAAVGANWNIIQANIDGAVIGPSSSVDSQVALFNLTSGKLLKISLVTIDSSGSVNIPSGQSYKINGTALSATNVGAEPTLTKGNLTESTSSVLTISGGTGSIIGSGTTIQVKQASSSVSGYLSSTDWSTFNGKATANGSNGYVQFYMSGALDSDSNFVWDDTNKRLGIGISAPTSNLDVYGTSNPRIKVSSGTATAPGLTIAQSGQTAWSIYNTASTSDLQFYCGAERVIIKSDGKVGIGTSAPDARLQINSWIESNSVGNTPTVLFWGNSGMSTTSETLLRLHRPVASGVSYNGGVDFNIYRYTTGSVAPYTQLNIALKSSSSYTQTADVTVMSLRANGNVGIGTIAPSTKLHVYQAAAPATLGSELVTNGSFTGGATGWTLGTGWEYGTDNVVFTLPTVSAGTLSQNISVTSGRYYLITWSQTCSTTYNGRTRPSIGSVNGKYQTVINTPTTTYSQTIIAGATGSLELAFNIEQLGTGTITIDNISVKEIASYAASILDIDSSNLWSVRANTNNSLTIGYNSGILTTTGSYNLSIGYQSFENNITGSSNVAVGNSALKQNVTGASNLAIGPSASRDNISGSDNIALGTFSLLSGITAFRNIAIGISSLVSATDSYGNIALGYQSAYSITTGNLNLAVGYQSLYSCTTGAGNVAIGQLSLFSLPAGSNYNTSIGYSALHNLSVVSSYNTAVGFQAGRYFGSGTDALTTSVYSVYLGYNTRASADSSNNEIVIGYNALGAGNNSATLGSTTVTKTVLRGAVETGINGTIAGSLRMYGSASGSCIVQVAAAAGATTFQLPVGNGSNGQVLKTDGSGATTWSAVDSLILSSPSSDHSYSGTTISATAGEAVAIGDVCYLKSDGKFWKADADAESSSDGMLSMATAAISADASGVFLLKGLYRDDTWSWTTGSKLYISTTPGNPTATAPSETGDIVRLVGYAYTADIVYFNPDNTFVELD